MKNQIKSLALTAITISTLSISCSKDQTSTKTPTNSIVVKNTRATYWDTKGVSTVGVNLGSKGGIVHRGTFATTWSGTSGNGYIYVAKLNSNNSIVAAWEGPYIAVNYKFDKPTTSAYQKYAIYFSPGANIAPASSFGIGTTVSNFPTNTANSDHAGILSL